MGSPHFFPSNFLTPTYIFSFLQLPSGIWVLVFYTLKGQGGWNAVQGALHRREGQGRYFLDSGQLAAMYMCVFPEWQGYLKVSYLEFYCFPLSFILLQISRPKTVFLSLCLFPVGMCAYHFCVLLFMLSIILSKDICLSTGPIYLSFLMAVYIIPFFLEIHKFILLNLLCFYFFFQGMGRDLLHF